MRKHTYGYIFKVVEALGNTKPHRQWWNRLLLHVNLNRI